MFSPQTAKLELHHLHHQPSLQDSLHGREEEDGESEEYCHHEEEDEEEGDVEDGHGRAYTGDYYTPEDNGNSVRVSPYRGRKVLVVEGETGEEAEEDIDQIVAEIKMSMSMGSLSSGTDQSPGELSQDPTLSSYPHPKPDAAPYPPAHHRHDSRPKSLNLPSMHHNNPDLQREPKAHPRSPEDRKRWTQEQGAIVDKVNFSCFLTRALVFLVGESLKKDLIGSNIKPQRHGVVVV